jgi:hypothetical protein
MPSKLPHKYFEVFPQNKIPGKTNVYLGQILTGSKKQVIRFSPAPC